MTLRTIPALLAAIVVNLLQPVVDASIQGGKPYPGLENLPKTFWHELSSPFTEVYQEESIPTENGATPEPRPFFNDPDSNVTVQLAAHAYLHCRVENLRERTVSWARRRGEELHLLTVGVQTYSSDSRFSMDFQQPNDWRLFLRSATERDAGVYECQVSVHPPLTRTVYLSVSVMMVMTLTTLWLDPKSVERFSVACVNPIIHLHCMRDLHWSLPHNGSTVPNLLPRVEIVDEHGATAGDKFYKAGSTIELKCVVSKVPHPTGYVTWRHGSRMLNYDTIRGGISVKTDMGAEGAVSRLYIANANKKDSGNYSCALAEVAATTVSVHVLNGENPAAMQHGGSAAIRAAFILIAVLTSATLLR